MSRLVEIERRLTACRRCPRLVDWREQIAEEKRAAYADQDYWGKPVPGFGDPEASLLVVGLAPGAHGANRTGRMFTGDRSGDWLFRALHRAGFASQPRSTAADDDLRLLDCYITAAVHCVPPANKPSADEQRECGAWLREEIAALTGIEVVVALGGLAFGRVLLEELGWGRVEPRPRFGHGVEAAFSDGPLLIASYHPSQQNTFTGRLTEPMLDQVFERAARVIRQRPS